jgi:hypothetical protein
MKVDGIQGSVKEMHSKAQSLKGDSTFNFTDSDIHNKLNDQHAEALKESKNYLIYLGKESEKWEKLAGEILTETQSQKRGVIAKSISNTDSTVNELEKLGSEIISIESHPDREKAEAVTKKVVSLTLQTKLEKAKLDAFELWMHLETKSDETKNSSEHYDELTENVQWVYNRLNRMSAMESLSAIDIGLSEIEARIVPLKKQTPYTLLMMRIVEIGLPLLLCFFSLLFVLKYSLTEKRSHEIKELIRLRNLERDSKS